MDAETARKIEAEHFIPVVNRYPTVLVEGQAVGHVRNVIANQLCGFPRARRTGVFSPLRRQASRFLEQ